MDAYQLDDLCLHHVGALLIGWCILCMHRWFYVFVFSGRWVSCWCVFFCGGGLIVVIEWRCHMRSNCFLWCVLRNIYSSGWIFVGWFYWSIACVEWPIGLVGTYNGWPRYLAQYARLTCCVLIITNDRPTLEIGCPGICIRHQIGLLGAGWSFDLLGAIYYTHLHHPTACTRPTNLLRLPTVSMGWPICILRMKDGRLMYVPIRWPNVFRRSTDLLNVWLPTALCNTDGRLN